MDNAASKKHHDETIGHVSDTALWVGAYRAMESERKDALFHDPLADKLAGKRGREIAKAMPYGYITAYLMAIRTVVIDNFVHEAIQQGVDAVINLGAGLDTRPYRLPLPTTLNWIEVDFPPMIQLKNEKLAQDKPVCQLKRIALDLTQRPLAQQLYRELGKQTNKALIITEGVVPYLTIPHAGHLADDLHSVPSFQFWVQDYRKDREKWRHPEKLQKKMANSPIQFLHPEPLEFFAERGWKIFQNKLLVEEGERLGRALKLPFPFNFLVRFMSAENKKIFRDLTGFVMFSRT